MKDSKKKVLKSSSWIFLFLICITTCFMGIGFAKINDINLSIDGDVLAESQEGIFITDIELSDSKNIDEENTDIKNYYQSMFQSNVVLSKDTTDTYVTYEITIYNKNEDIYYLKNINYEGLYTNYGITFSMEDFQIDDIINPGEYKTFYFTFEYNNDTLAESNELESYIDFEFAKVYLVTYENFADTSTYPTYVIPNKTLTAAFGTLDAPIEVTMNESILSSDSYNYSNYTLTLANATSNVHVRKLTKYTIKNKVNNGSFELGNLNYWGVEGTNSEWGIAKIPHLGTYCAYRKANAEKAHVLVQNLYWYEGHMYYYFGYAISSTQQKFTCDVTNKGGQFTITSVPSVYTKGSSIYTATFTGANYISVNWAATTDNVNCDCIGVVDLTEAFGAGNEPDKEWCDQNIDYFEGSTIVYK